MVGQLAWRIDQAFIKHNTHGKCFLVINLELRIPLGHMLAPRTQTTPIFGTIVIWKYLWPELSNAGDLLSILCICDSCVDFGLISIISVLSFLVNVLLRRLLGEVAMWWRSHIHSPWHFLVLIFNWWENSAKTYYMLLLSFSQVIGHCDPWLLLFRVELVSVDGLLFF